MILTQEQLNKATTEVEEHLKDIGIQNQLSLLGINPSIDNEFVYNFEYEISNPTFKTIIFISYDFSNDNNKDLNKSSFSWMDYKKITE